MRDFLTVTTVQDPRGSNVYELRKLLVRETKGEAGVSLPLGLTFEKDKSIDQDNLSIEPVLKIMRAHGNAPDEDLLRRAFQFAKDAHAAQVRNSGNPYILHPLAVASILADLELDSTTVAAGLLHDVVEDTSRTLADIREAFGKEIATLVDGVTNVSRLELHTREEHQNENLRRLLVATARDMRVIMIKLSDRLHNMRTLKFLPLEKQISISETTLNVFAPLAHRMGIGRIKWELEDHALSYLNPEAYRMLKERVSLRLADRQAYVERVKGIVGDVLHQKEIPFEIFGRVKHFYSIWRKMQKEGVDISEIFDLQAIRIITDTPSNCYVILGVIHSLYRQVEGRFKDYISVPKTNGYQSLHTTVFGPENRMLEVQIRTWEMHRIAQQGVAAHWRYKEDREDHRGLQEDSVWLNQLSAWLEDAGSIGNIGDSLSAEIFADEIFCYTPRGDIIRLPAESTPIDFAYKIHTDLGDHIQRARVGNKMVPIDHPLSTGDRVEVVTSPSAHPRPEWLNWVKTSRAKSKIRRFLIDRHREELMNLGKTLLTRELMREQFDPNVVFRSREMNHILESHGYASLEDLFVDIGFGRYQPRQVISSLRRKDPHAEETAPGKRRETIHSSDFDGIRYRRALCCNPLPGEPVIGLVTKSRCITVHRADCNNVAKWKGNAERVIDLFWETGTNEQVRAEIDIEGMDRVRLLGDLANVIASTNTNIMACNTRSLTNKHAKFHFDLEVANSAQLEDIIRRIERLPGVLEVSRRRVPFISRRHGRG